MPNKDINELTAQHLQLIALCALIAGLTFFDFWAFWYVADAIMQLFFADNTSSGFQDFWALVLFLAGYVARPSGGWLIGQYGDKHGRKQAAMLSLLGVTFFTLMMAVLPTYAQLGNAALALFIVARLGQGMAFGSQLPTLWVYIVEHLPLRNIGMGGGMVTAGTLAGTLLLFCTLSVIEGRLSHVEMLSYGWRLPFIMGGILSLVAAFALHFCQETPIFLANASTKQHVTPSLKSRWRGALPILIMSWFFASVMIVLVLLFEDLTTLAFHADNGLLEISLVVSWVFLMIGSVFFGFLTDRVPTANVLIFGAGALMVLCAILFYDLAMGGHMMLLSFALMGFVAGIIGAMPAVMVRLASVHHRLTTLSTCYSTAFTLVGIIAPALLGFLTFYASFTPALYISFVCLMVIFMGFYLDNHPRNKEDLTRS